LARAEAHYPPVTVVETGIKTFLIADVRGYTRFTQERGDEAAARLATRFAELAREAIEAAGGTLVELRGDEVMAVFDSARQAIRAAADLQERLVDETVGDPSLPLAVGIGLDAGEAVAVDGGYRGGALNLAARLCSLAGPGEVLVSREVAHLARKVEGLDYVERGPARMKNLDQPVDVIAVRPEHEDEARITAFRAALGIGAAPALDARNPYKGLRAFAEGDADDFFGREALTEHLVERLGETRFLAVVGPSGSGKSSVVRAGLVPRLRQGALPGSEHWHIVEMFPGAYPLEELEAALLRTADSAPAGLLEQLEQDERGLLRAVKRLLTDDDSELVLVVDQLEEVFTLVEDEARRTQFLALLERAVADPHARLRIVVTLRADFYDRPLLYSGFAELLRDYVEALVPLKADEFERAIAGPAERVGAKFEPGLLAELVADVADEPGALPLLQYALTELFERREGSMLTADAYSAIGGISGALAGRAEEIYGGLGEPAQEASRQLFLRLVTLGEGAEDTRRRVERTELASMEVDQVALEEAIQEFGAWRLLSFDRDPRSGTPTIEVAHEALMREWSRFRRWIDNGREQVRLHRRLATAAREWEGADREASYLLRGSNLAQFESLAGESTIALTELEREFVEASTAANELELARERRQNRRLKGLLIGAVALLLLALIAGALALVSRSSAQHEAQVALGRQLGAEAVSQPRVDISMLLARESLKLDDSPQTEGTLLATLLRSPAVTGTFALPVPGRPQAVKVSPDGRSIATVTNCCGMRIYGTRTRRLLRTIALANADYAYVPSTGQLFAGWYGKRPGQIAQVLVDPRNGHHIHKFTYSPLWLTNGTNGNDVAVTHDGRYGFFVYSMVKMDGTDGLGYIEAWRLNRNGPPMLVRCRASDNTGIQTPQKKCPITTGVTGLVVAAEALSGDRLMVAQNGRITTWRASDMKRLTSVPGPRFAGSAVSVGSVPAAISPDGSMLAYGLSDGTVRFFDIAHDKTISGQGAHSSGVVRMAFSPDSSVAVSTADDGTAILWNPRTGQLLQRFGGHSARVLGADFSPNSKTLYTAGLDGTILEYDLGASRRFGSPFSVGHTAARGLTIVGPPLLAMAPDGRTFAAGVEQSKIGIFSTSKLRRVAEISLPASRTIFKGAWAGRRFVLGADKGLVQVWTVAGGKSRPVTTLRGLSNQGNVVSVATGEGGRLIAAVDGYGGGPSPEKGELALWRDGKLVTGHTLDLGTNGLWVAISPDGSMAAVGLDNGKALIVNTSTGRVERTIRPPKAGFVGAVSFAPNGTLAVGDYSGLVSLWNPKTGQEVGKQVLVAEGPSGVIAFAPDGASFTTGSYGGHSRLWDTSTLQQLGSDFPGSNGYWSNVAYTPDGRYQIVIYGDGTAYRWPMRVGAWEHQACSVAGRNFTTEEWRRFVGGRSYSKVCS
jgi:WD40 repeat protein/class 3 adenylate cyclase